ncbi:MAG: cobalamin-dependent protein, partial [Pedobacter sp.]
MKILFVSPGWPKGRLWGELTFKFPSLSLAAIAAVTPDEWELEFCDDSFEKLDYSTNADIIALTAMTAQVSRAYEIADAFRKRGKTVVMGGFHVSNLPEEALAHADAVVVGEGELVWPGLLADWRANTLQQIYKSGSLMEMVDTPAARREMFKG